MRGGLKLGSGRWEQVAMKIKEFLRKHIFPFIPTLKIPEVSRISLDFELGRQFKRLKPGIVLDAGSKDGVYKNYVPHTKFMRLDIDEKSEPDICCDLHEIEWQSRYFDTVIATEVLEHLYDPQKAIDQIYFKIEENHGF